MFTSTQLEKMDSNQLATDGLIIEHTFDAPITSLWQAWCNAELVKQWWGPDGFSCPMAEIDFREGGTSLLSMLACAEYGGQLYYSTWRYVKLVREKEIEYMHNLSDSNGNTIDPMSVGMTADFPQEQRHVIKFEPLTEGKTKVTVTEYGWSPGKMMEDSRLGMTQCLQKMAKAIANN
jgi:uncharacterized protein YndB with AHSA1/START domain